MTFELSQAKSGTSSLAATPPPLVPSDCQDKTLSDKL